MSNEPTARFEMPDLLERDIDNTLTLNVWFDGALVTDAGTTGTITITDSGGTVKVGPTAFSIVSLRPTHTVSAATLSSDDFGEGWTVEWNITLATGEVYNFRNEAALVRRKLYPVVTDSDLFRRASSLDPSGTNPITTVSNFQDYLTEAWVTIQLRLWSSGDRPNLVMSPASLRDVHLFLTLSLVFRDLSTRLNEAYFDHAERYAGMYEGAFTSLKFRYDTGSEDGVADSDARRGATSSIWLCGRR